MTLPALDDETDDGLLVTGSPVGEHIVERLLGSGGFARVYQAVHPTLGSRVAVKVLDRSVGVDHESIQRFTREAQAANRINHPSVVKVLGFGKLADGRAYQVMELIEGLSLDEHIEKHGQLSKDVALQLLSAIADALSAAHSIGIVHRDLKPSNVLIATQGDTLIPLLTDFGIAKAIDREEDSKLTRTGSTLGTPFYMSPEQALGSKIGPESDIYAFGVVAFELLTGQVPFNGESPFAVMMKHVQAEPPTLSQVAPAMGNAFDAPIAQMLSKRPADRQPTIASAMHDLRQAAAVPAGHGQKLVAKASKNSRRVKLAAAAIALLVGGAGALAWRSQTPTVQPAIEMPASKSVAEPASLQPAAPQIEAIIAPTADTPSKPASTTTPQQKPTIKKQKAERDGQRSRPDSDSIEVPPDYQTP